MELGSDSRVSNPSLGFYQTRPKRLKRCACASSTVFPFPLCYPTIFNHACSRVSPSVSLSGHLPLQFLSYGHLLPQSLSCGHLLPQSWTPSPSASLLWTPSKLPNPFSIKMGINAAVMLFDIWSQERAPSPHDVVHAEICKEGVPRGAGCRYTHLLR